MRFSPLSIVISALVFCLGLILYLLGQFLQMRGDLAETTRRLKQVEVAVQKRENADPLVARECAELGLGGSPAKPCHTTLYHLALTPQRYHGVWVIVQGIYASGFEHSAIYPMPSEPGGTLQILNQHSALWVQVGVPDTNSRPVISVTGRFKRGPAGHMGDYFGELIEAKLLSNSEKLKESTSQ
jgi:hypothetical protein